MNEPTLKFVVFNSIIIFVLLLSLSLFHSPHTNLFCCDYRFDDTDEYEPYETNIDLLESQIDDGSNEW